MAYIGRGTENISNVEVLDNLTFNGSASYSLQKSSTNFVPSSANNLLISISGVVQQGNFSVSGSTITFDTTVSASDTCDWILHYGTGLITTVADGAITEAKLGSNAVTTAKINDSAVTYAKTDGNFGKIGQVQSTTLTTTFSATPAGGTFTDISGLSVSITPTSTSSKIYVTCNVPMASVQGSDNSTSVGIRLMRDSTPIFVGTSGTGNQTNLSAYSADVTSDVRNMTVVSANGLDSPSTTSAVTYKVQLTQGFNLASATRTVYVNRNDQGSDVYGAMRTASTITVMEVLA